MIVGYVIIDTEARKFYAEDDASGGYLWWTNWIASARIFDTPELAQERINFWWRPESNSYVRDVTQSPIIGTIEVAEL